MAIERELNMIPVISQLFLPDGDFFKLEIERISETIPVIKDMAFKNNQIANNNTEARAPAKASATLSALLIAEKTLVYNKIDKTISPKEIPPKIRPTKAFFEVFFSCMFSMFLSSFCFIIIE